MGKRLLGFDFGNREIKIAVCKDGVIQRFVTSQTPDNLIEAGNIVSFNAMADQIKEIVRSEHISGKAAIVALPMSSCFVRRVQLPLMNIEQLKVNLPFEFRDYITGEPDNYVYDYAVLNRGENDMELMAAATSREVMSAYKDMMKRAGLKLVGLVPEVLGIQTLLGCGKTNERGDYAVLDMGHDSTRLHFFSKGAFEITHTMENGGKQAARVLAEEMGLDIHIAQLYLENNQDNVLDLPAITDLYEEVATEIMRDLNFYSYNNPENGIDCLFYFGSGLSDEKLMTLVGQMTDLPTIPLVKKVEGGEAVEQLSHGPQAFGIVIQ